METRRGLERKMDATEELQSVVKTMKALAAVSIRQYEKAVEALDDYSRATEMALQVVLGGAPSLRILARPAPARRAGALVFGSDQGMCGQLNDQVVSHAVSEMDARDTGRSDRTFLAVGLRAAGRLEQADETVEDVLPVPGSANAITLAVQEILSTVQKWQGEKGLDHIWLFHSRPISGASFEPRTVRLLPLDSEWLQELLEREWPGRSLPQYTADWNQLFSSLVRQYLFVSLFRAFANSLASEHASRLASMQAAEKNIEERLRELTAEYHQRRQMEITSELLDIVSGFEALTKGNSAAG